MKLTFQQDDETNLRSHAEAPRDSTLEEDRPALAAPSEEGLLPVRRSPRVKTELRVATPEPSDKPRNGLSRARKQLSQAMGGVLSSPLGALLRSPSSSTSHGAGAASGHRLREVIERDRALAAAQPRPNEVVEPHVEDGFVTVTDIELEAAEVLATFHEVPAPSPMASPDDDEFGFQDDPVTTRLQTVPAPRVDAQGSLASAPREDAIARAIADAIEDGQEELGAESSQPIKLEPLMAASAKSVVSGKSEKRPVVCKEPIRTRTMAKLLATQGHRARALSIYDHLIDKSPHDEVLQAEANALREAQD